MKIDSAL